MADAPTQPSRSRRPSVRAVLGGIAAFAVVALVAAVSGWIYRTSIADFVLVRRLQDLGLQAVQLEVTHLDTKRIELRDLRLGAGPDLELARVEAAFSAEGLRRGRLDEIRLSGLRVRGTLDADGLRLGTLDALRSGPDGGGAEPGAPPALPAPELTLADGQLELETPWGPLRAALAARASDTGGGRLEATGQLTARHALGELTAQLDAAGAADAVTGTLEVSADAPDWSAGDLSIRGASVRSEATLSFDGTELALRTPECSTLDVAAIELRGAASSAKPVSLCFQSSREPGGEPALAIAADGTFRVRLELAPTSLAIALGGASPQRVEGELPRLAFRADAPAGAPLRAQLESEGGRLELPALGLRAEGVRFFAQVGSGASIPEGCLRIDEIVDVQRPKRLPALGVDLRFGPDAGSAGSGARLAFEAELFDIGRHAVVVAKGTHDLQSGSGQAAFELPPVALGAKGVPFGQLFPLLSDLVERASGTIAAREGTLRWGADGVVAKVQLGVEQLDATTDVADFKSLNATIDFEGTGSRPRQMLWVERIGFGVELTDGLVTFQLRPDGKIEIDEARWKLAGGTLTTSGTLDPLADEQEILLRVDAVDVAQLTQLIALDGLTGSGTLDGVLPLRRKGSAMFIHEAELHARGSGWIRYGAEGGATALGASETQFGDVLRVLENFHYDRLELYIDGNTREQATVRVRLAGANPDFANGHPVDFTLNVEGRLADLILSESRILQMPAAIEARLAGLRGPGQLNSGPAASVHAGGGGRPSGSRIGWPCVEALRSRAASASASDGG